MNIVLINHYAGSTEMGMEFRPYYFAREWVRMGHRVHMIAADYSHLRVKNPEVAKDFQTERISGIYYHWIKTGQYEGNGVNRALTMFRFVGKLWLAAKRIAEVFQPDVVITSSTYPLDTYAGQKIARMCGAKLIHEVHDLWPLTLTELGGMRRSHPFVRLLQMAENSAYRHSDHVVSLLPAAKEYMVRHGMKPEKFVHIPNGVVPEDWDQPSGLPQEHRRLLENLKENGRFIAGYFGGHALSNMLDLLLDAAQIISDPHIQFVLTGDGVEKQRLMERARQEKIRNVMFLPPVPKQAVPELLSYFDCSLVCAADSPLYRYGICFNKIYDSMMAGRPVICNVHTTDCIIEKYRCGVMVKRSGAAELARVIEEYCKIPQKERQKTGDRGRTAVRKYFTYGILAGKFASLFYGTGS